jgi:hypothetical protein
MKALETENHRPISAFNKMTNSRKNLLPRLTSANSGINNSKSPHLSRIKSAIPYDKEKLYEENLILKNELNKIKQEYNVKKKENYILESELSKKDKMLEDMAIDTQTSMINHIENMNDLYNQNKLLTRATETHLIINLKKQFKEVKRELTNKKEEFDNLKKTLKNTKVNELTTENKILFEENSKLKGLYESALKQMACYEDNMKDFNLLKDSFNKQEYIIMSLQENMKQFSDNVVTRDESLAKMTKSLTDKTNQINKLKKDLKFQYGINERLLSNMSNVKSSPDYIAMKTELQGKVEKIKKDLTYYKDLAEKKERRLKELESLLAKPSSTNNTLTTSKFEENPEEKINSTVLLLKSKLQEVLKERDNLKSINETLNLKLDKLENGYKSESNEHYIFTRASRDFVHDISKKWKGGEYDYLSDFNLNEVIYILIKNFEAAKLDVNIIEERILKDENSNSLIPLLDSDEKQFSNKITDNIISILRVKKESDKKSIFSFVKTFVHNYYTMTDKKQEEFKQKFLFLFESINFYGGDQKQLLTKKLIKKLKPFEAKLVDAIKSFDENQLGYITFVTLRKIMEQIKLKLNNDLVEYFIYLMKSFSDEQASINDLKYENILKMLGTEECCQKEAEEEEDEEQEEILEDQEEAQENLEMDENEESAIEITTEQYLKKVKNVIKKIANVLKLKKRKIEDLFSELVLPEVKEYKAIELIKLVEILNEDFNIILDSIDIFCLYTKLKPDVDSSEESEEYVDYNKLLKEVQDFMYNNTVVSSKTQTLRENDSDRKPLDDIVIPKEDFIQILKFHLEKFKMPFEDFILGMTSKIKTSNKNRFIDISDFENLLLTKEIIVVLINPVNNNKLIINTKSHKEKVDENLLYNNYKINLDYLKYLLTGIKLADKFGLYDPGSK